MRASSATEWCSTSRATTTGSRCGSTTSLRWSTCASSGRTKNTMRSMSGRSEVRVKAIRTEADHKAALERIDALMDASAGTAAGDELDVLVDLVEHYEEKHVPMGFPTPVAAIEFRMEQAGLSPRDLVHYIGSRAKVSEVLSGKRALTIGMARALHQHLGIPAEVLLQQAYDPELGQLKSADWSRFPV